MWRRIKQIQLTMSAAAQAEKDALYGDVHARKRIRAANIAPMEHWRIEERELKFGSIIGQGNVGEVYEGVYGGQRVAIKKLLGNWAENTDMVERFKDEILLMSSMHHPNVLNFIGAVMDVEAGNMCLVTELCPRGTLHDTLHSSTPLDWRLRLRLACDIARGMAYLHGRAGIIQRDLKSANLLLDEYNAVKIADFGLSRQMNTNVMETYCGTPSTMAPEIVRQEPYTEKADVFSFAIILWELLTRQEPYGGKGGLGLAVAVANNGLRPPIPAYCPAEYASIMTRAWHADQHARPSFQQILDELTELQDIADASMAVITGAMSAAAGHAQSPLTPQQPLPPQPRQPRSSLEASHGQSVEPAAPPSTSPQQWTRDAMSAARNPDDSDSSDSDESVPEVMGGLAQKLMAAKARQASQQGGGSPRASARAASPPPARQSRVSAAVDHSIELQPQHVTVSLQEHSPTGSLRSAKSQRGRSASPT